MIPPSIIVGVGGQGSAIALGVKERLKEFARARATPLTEKAELDAIEKSVRIFSLDIDHNTAINSRFTQNELLLLKPASPDAMIKARTGYLEQWWPEHITQPGGFINGAGGMRAKGRLAYYMLGRKHAEQIANSVDKLRANAQTAGYGIGTAITVFVYIVGSVSGGTGSGIMLTLAQHLRSLVDDDVHIVGAIPLASIMQHGPGDFQRDNIYANCSAALREIDWWMLPEKYRPASIAPFFYLNGTPIAGNGSDHKNETPFDLCYLFAESNQAGKPLPSFGAYTELIADCIALDVDSPAASASHSLISNILGGLNNKISPPVDDGSKATKSVLFAGAGAASIVFSVPETTGYLGDHLLLHVLDSIVLISQDRGDEARRWLNNGDREVLPNAGQVRLRERLKQAHTDVATGQVHQAEAAPEPRFENVDRKSWVTLVRNQRSLVDDTWLKTLRGLLARNEPIILNELWGQLLVTVNTTLEENRGNGLRHAADLLRGISGSLASRIEALTNEIDSTEPNRPGLRQKLDLGVRRYDEAIERLTVGGKSPFGGKGKQDAQAQTFLSNWWRPYVSTQRDIAEASAELSLLTNLNAHVARLRIALEQAITELERQRVDLRLGLDDHFKQSRGQMAQQDRVLADRALVDEVFARDITNAQTPDSQALRDIAVGFTTSGSSLRTWLLKPANQRGTQAQEAEHLSTAVSSAVRDARNKAADQFSATVQSMSIWDAMEHEFYARVGLGKVDTFLDAVGGVPGTGDAARRLTQYMQSRVSSCIAAAVPYWSLSRANQERYQNLYHIIHSVQASYAQEPFDAPNASDALIALKQALPSMLSGGSAPDTSGQSIHHFFVSSREWGAPLFMINDDERQKMTHSERTWTRQKGHVYIDQRYVGVLPDDLSLEGMQQRIDQLAEQRRHANAATEATLRRVVETLGIALELGYARENKVGGSFDIAISASKHVYHRYGQDIYDAIQELHDRSDKLDEIADVVNDKWSELPTSEQRDKIGNRINVIDRQIGEMPPGKDPKKDTLQLMKDAMVGLQQDLNGHR
ncbi:MAG TPA: tubulin-like doman-containing protein [Thermomicrobiales bacterium]|nr:tubulin-like doman-containing protein [Thermomicrobiales bacterium]